MTHEIVGWGPPGTTLPHALVRHGREETAAGLLVTFVLDDGGTARALRYAPVGEIWRRAPLERVGRDGLSPLGLARVVIPPDALAVQLEPLGAGDVPVSDLACTWLRAADCFEGPWSVPAAVNAPASAAPARAPDRLRLESDEAERQERLARTLADEQAATRDDPSLVGRWARAAMAFLAHVEETNAHLSAAAKGLLAGFLVCNLLARSTLALCVVAGVVAAALPWTWLLFPLVATARFPPFLMFVVFVPWATVIYVGTQPFTFARFVADPLGTLHLGGIAWLPPLAVASALAALTGRAVVLGGSALLLRLGGRTRSWLDPDANPGEGEDASMPDLPLPALAVMLFVRGYLVALLVGNLLLSRHTLVMALAGAAAAFLTWPRARALALTLADSPAAAAAVVLVPVARLVVLGPMSRTPLAALTRLPELIPPEGLGLVHDGFIDAAVTTLALGTALHAARILRRRLSEAADERTP